MGERSLTLSKDVKLVANHWDGFPARLALEYIEHSPDPWYYDTESSLDIEEADALRIIEFLRDTFWPAPGAEKGVG